MIVELLSESRLDGVLRALNPWWTSGTLPQSARPTQARGVDAFLRGTERPALLVGPRRAGKSCTLLRLVDQHLRSAEGARQVAYLPLDHPILRLAPPGPLVDRALRLMGGGGRPLLLLDGLQALPQWPERYVELLKTRPQARYVAAASVAPGEQDPHYDVVPLLPFTFREFCDRRGVPDLGVPPFDPFDPRLPEESAPADDILHARVLDPLLADYLVRGGFPEALFDPDLAHGHQAIREGVVARAIYQDLPSVVGVQKLADLERVLLASLLQGGAPLVVESFADALELDRHTVNRYLEHLERAYLLLSLKNFAASTDRSRARIFATDPGIPNALFEQGLGVLTRGPERRSLLTGALVAQMQAAARARGHDLAYFREGDLEADAVLVRPEGAVPVVLLDRDDVGEEDAARVERLLKRMQARGAILLSRGGPRRRESLTFFETIYHLPVGYFLYALRA